MTIVKYDKAAKEALGKTCYYLSVSAMQKSIRRGETERAINFAKVVWRMEPYRLFARMWTVLFEDCGRSTSALLAFYKYRGGYSTFEKLVPLIRVMSEAQKSREAVWLSQWLKGRNFDSEAFTKVVYSTYHESLIQLIRDFPLNGVDSYSIWDFGVGDSNFDWTIELAERSLKFDYEKIGEGVPYWFNVFAQEEPRVSQDEVGPLALYDGFFPLEAADAHTGPGQHAIHATLKYKSRELKSYGLSCEYDMVAKYLFIFEGWKYRNYNPYHSLDFDRLGREMEYFEHTQCSHAAVVDTQETQFAKVLPDLLNTRRWLLSREYHSDMTKLKTAYFDQYLT